MNRGVQIVAAVSVLMIGMCASSEADFRAGISFDGGSRHGGGGGVMIRMRQQNVWAAGSASVPSGSVTTRIQPRYPTTYGNGNRISAAAATTPPSAHASIVRNAAIVGSIQSQARVEVVPNRYYWHQDNGARYCHYFDGAAHWYGFYLGPTFYWTQFYSGYWWWFDVNFDRWVFWRDGYWWWSGPDGVAYAYVDNNYYPYDEQGNVTVKTPEVVAPPKAIPATTAGTSWKSPDGKRMVQLYGDRSEAFLYDQSSSRPVFLKYLGQGVEKVRFTNGAGGKSLRILIEFKDGSFALASEDGNPIDEEPRAAPAAAPSGAASNSGDDAPDLPGPPGKP